MADLLNRFSVADRITEDFTDLSDLFNSKINYSIVNKKLDISRKESLDYIENCLSNV